jgi:hypothetical protein
MDTLDIYMDGINRTKGPIVMFMGHKKEAHQMHVKHMLAPLSTAGVDGAGYQIIASCAFAEKYF